MPRPAHVTAEEPSPSRALEAALAATLVALAPWPARASAPGEPITAVRLRGEVIVDGRADEPAWREAPVYDGFVQLFPREGAAPSEQTELRVVYDDRHLYVSVVARDREPARMKRPLGRRDAHPYSDSVMVVIDAKRDGRLAYWFEVNAAGILSDGLLYGDDQSTTDWDAVWAGATHVDETGWSAELAIPLAALRFSDAPTQTWGFGVKRVLARNHEDIASVLIPRTARGRSRASDRSSAWTTSRRATSPSTPLPRHAPGDAAAVLGRHPPRSALRRPRRRRRPRRPRRASAAASPSPGP